MVDRVYFTVIFLLILGASGYFVYDRIQALRENVQILKTNAEVMNNSLKESNETILQMQRNAEAVEQQISELNTGLREAEKYKDEITEKLQKHNLTRLSAAKPGLIEKRVNEATSKIFKELEDITATNN
jgi:cell division protein FtsB